MSFKKPWLFFCIEFSFLFFFLYYVYYFYLQPILCVFNPSPFIRLSIEMVTADRIAEIQPGSPKSTKGLNHKNISQTRTLPSNVMISNAEHKSSMTVLPNKVCFVPCPKFRVYLQVVRGD